MTRKDKSLMAVARTLDGRERTVPVKDTECPETEQQAFGVPQAGNAAPTCGANPARDKRRSSRWRLAGAIATLILLLGFAAAWKWTRMSEFLDIDLVLRWTRWLGESRLAPLYVPLIYTLSGLVAFPVTILIVATALTFGAVAAFVYSMAGCLASAAALFFLGHLLGRETIQRFAGERLARFNESLARQGLYTIIALRLFPVGPYTVVNFMAGASEIRFRDYMLGTFIGMVPALVLVTVLGDRLGDALRHPSASNLLLLAVVTAAFVVANILVRRSMNRRKQGSRAGQENPS